MAGITIHTTSHTDSVDIAHHYEVSDEACATEALSTFLKVMRDAGYTDSSIARGVSELAECEDVEEMFNYLWV